MARREHSRWELTHKLARACDDQELIEELLEKLSIEGLQSDERFTESFVNHRISSGKGPLKIKKELLERGVEKFAIEQYLESYPVNWQLQAEMVRVKKFGERLPADKLEKSKQSRFLLNRGFSSQLISQLLS